MWTYGNVLRVTTVFPLSPLPTIIAQVDRWSKLRYSWKCMHCQIIVLGTFRSFPQRVLLLLKRLRCTMFNTRIYVYSTSSLLDPLADIGTCETVTNSAASRTVYALISQQIKIVSRFLQQTIYSLLVTNWPFPQVRLAGHKLCSSMATHTRARNKLVGDDRSFIHT